MKKFTGVISVVTAALTMSFNALALNAEVTVDRDSGHYVLNWQSAKSVSVTAQGERSDKTILISDKLNNGVASLQWMAPTQDRYTFTFTEQQGEQTQVRSRLLNLNGGRNFRDLGGYETADGRRVKWGKLYRSGALHNLDAADYAMLSELDIETVVDFRGNSERQNELTQWQAGDINHMTWDYQLDFDSSAFKQMFAEGRVTEQDMEQVMAGMYPGLLNQQKNHYKAMFAELVADDKPLLFHCTAGKDRTGVAAALILYALGVEKDVIMQDYVLSEQILRPAYLMGGHQERGKEHKQDASMAMLARLPKEAIGALMGTRESYLNAAFTEMETQSGSIDAFIREELNVSDTDIARLKAQYLD